MPTPPDEIQDAETPDPNAVPEVLLIPAPFVVGHDCEIEPRGGELCSTCQQPACCGAVAVLRCDCGQLFRVDLLGDEPNLCPGCTRTYVTGLVVCQPDNPDAFLEALAVVLRANGYQVADPGAGDDDDDDDDQADDDDDEREATEDDAEDAGEPSE